MGYFQVRYDSRVVNYERKLFIRWATGLIVGNTDLYFVSRNTADQLFNSFGFRSFAYNETPPDEPEQDEAAGAVLKRIGY